MRQIRVCIVSTYAYPLFNPECKAVFGGAEVQMYLLAKYLARDENISVTVVVGDFGQEKWENRFGVNIIRSHSKKKGYLDYLIAPVKLFRSIGRSSPDVVIQRAAGPETGICALFCIIKRKIFMYSVAHDVDITGGYIGSNPIYAKLFRFGITNAHKIVLQTEDQRRALEKWNCNLAFRAIKILNSIEVPIGRRTCVRKNHILWVARAESWKRPELYVELARRIPSEKFLMIMPGSTLDKDLISRIDETDNLEKIDYIEFSDIQKVFDASKLLINTSRHEGFANTFLQAGLAGTPIISYEVDPDSFIKNRECGFVCNGDFDVLVDSVKILLDNKKLWTKMSNNVLQYVRDMHNIGKNINMWKIIIM